MDQVQFTTWLRALSTVPDPRHARGQRYPWLLLLALLALGLASGQKTAWAVAGWLKQHQATIQPFLPGPLDRLPSASTFYRLLYRIDVLALEAAVAAYGQAQAAAVAPQEPLQAQAVDGKELRGTRPHGPAVHLVSLVRQGDGLILGQCRVPDKTNEPQALPLLLAGRDLHGTITSFDALYTQRAIAQQIVAQGGHYLMVVKANQPELREALATLFAEAALPGEERWTYTAWGKGHGRQERRTVVASELLNDYLDWPGLGQVLQRTCERRLGGQGCTSGEVSYAVTSLRHAQASAAQLAGYWRGHWTIENRSHDVRDETLGEDRGQGHVGPSAQALAALRNGLLVALRRAGWTSIPAALRAHMAPDPVLLSGVALVQREMQQASTSQRL